MTERVRRNDGEGAGVAGEAFGVQAGDWRPLAASHPPPSLPPKRGEG